MAVSLDRIEVSESSDWSSVGGPGDLGNLEDLTSFAGVSDAERFSWSTPFGKAGAGGGMALLSLFGDGGGGSGRLEAKEERLGITDSLGDPFEPLGREGMVGDQRTLSTLECSLEGWWGDSCSGWGPGGILSCVGALVGEVLGPSIEAWASVLPLVGDASKSESIQCCALDSAVRAVVRSALSVGAEVYAIYEGYQGMIDGGDN